jgi:hypothetical protein
MKPLAPRIVEALSMRRVLVANALVSSLLVALPGVFGPHWAGWAMFALLAAGGFARSLQFTTLNALLYCDVPRAALSRATTFGSVMQELAGTVGVAIAALALGAPRGTQGDAALDTADFPLAFALIGAISSLSLVVFLRLPPQAGAGLNRQPPR